MNPYEMQRRIAKAVILADMADSRQFNADEFESEWSERYDWAELCGVRPPSRETWDMAVDLLRSRAAYDGPGGLDDPQFVQRLTKMAIDITETLSRNDVDSDEAEVLPKVQKRLVAKLAKADTSATTFDLGKIFLKMREEFRLKR